MTVNASQTSSTDQTVQGTVSVSITVNDTRHDLEVSPSRRLITVLRDDLGLTGSKIGCEVGICGACTVLVDGRATSSCLTLAVQVDGATVQTIEGLGDDPEFARLQRSFLTEGGSQCGFCTSGQLTALAAVQGERPLQDVSKEELVDELHGNLCRCTGYYGILRAAGKLDA